MLKVHLYGAFNVTRAAMPHFREQEHGRIVVTTSVTGLYGNFGQANYGAAKLGLVGLVNTVALEGRSRNVLANAVSPLARTRMSVDILDYAFAPEFASVLVAYLVSDECTHHAARSSMPPQGATRAFVTRNPVAWSPTPSRTSPRWRGRWDDVMDMQGRRSPAGTRDPPGWL